jgi:hypothetical protein
MNIERLDSILKPVLSFSSLIELLMLRGLALPMRLFSPSCLVHNSGITEYRALT